MTQRLKLGPLPKTGMVKITLLLPIALQDDLQRYAELHAEASGEKNELPQLIPHMLQVFIASDRVFRRENRPR